ncbi:hypothetical protein [Sulfobacillus thermosulfidooxidans]|uniref:hypothetical protein n=1 Tax=Sulfobacillus thermosulfidooxidans TaxID=28034 RepID=UPI0006B48853|nr:hypothetical protein [Sulfobacillus thermosulfidooxidans]
MVMTPIEKMYLWFMFAAYTGLFLIMFGFMAKMLGKTRQLITEVKRLEDQWASMDSTIRTNVPPAVAPNVPGPEL